MRNQHNLSNAKYWFLREKVKTKNIEKIVQKLLLFSPYVCNLRETSSFLYISCPKLKDYKNGKQK